MLIYRLSNCFKDKRICNQSNQQQRPQKEGHQKIILTEQTKSQKTDLICKNNNNLR